VVPSPRAMRVTGVSVAQLVSAELPTHYVMIRAIREKLLSWSPSLFIGFNAMSFDERLLRQALYQTLHPPYLTNTGGNCRADALRMVRAAALFTAGARKTSFNGVDQLALFCSRAKTNWAPRASTFVATGRLQCSASAVTMQPSSDSICSVSKAPRVSLRPGASREASTIRASTANTLTICSAVQLLLRPARLCRRLPLRR
jgi:hypothetical protein